MYPVLFQFGSLTISSFGVMMVIAFLLGNYLLRKDVVAEGYEPIVAEDITFRAAIGGILGAKIYYLIETIPTERFFDSLLGTDVRESLFDNYTRGQVVIIEDQIRETCKRFEPRVDNVGVIVDANPDDNNLNVKVFFDIVGLESTPQSFSFILEPTR